jgi:geranylgeranyl pyrophosphate synthase
MNSEEKLMHRVICLLQERGQKSVELSRQIALENKTGYKPIDEAIRFFVNDFWFDVLHPALVSLSCEAVGGKTEETVDIGAAIVLLAGAADIHDDIIDRSTVKEPIPTVFGKFGHDVAILTGDALMVNGLYALHESCIPLSKNKAREILDSIKKAFFEICGAEAQEASLRGKKDISRQEYIDIIRRKVAAAEATTRIGAIIGGGTEKEIELLSHYGRTYGMLMSLRDDFVDLFEPDELRNRIKNECLPLPILLALSDDSRRSAILQLLNEEINERTVEKMLDLSIEAGETQKLISDMKCWIEKEVASLGAFVQRNDNLVLLLRATVEDLR